MAERLLRVGEGPVCPRCGWDQFDDWHHALKQEKPWQTPHGHLDCECGHFRIEGTHGHVVSTCYGVDRS